MNHRYRCNVISLSQHTQGPFNHMLALVQYNISMEIISSACIFVRPPNSRHTCLYVLTLILYTYIQHKFFILLVLYLVMYKCLRIIYSWHLPTKILTAKLAKPAVKIKFQAYLSLRLCIDFNTNHIYIIQFTRTSKICWYKFTI